MDKKQIRQQLLDSMEFKHLWSYFTVSAVVCAVFLLAAVARNPKEGLGIAVILYSVVLAPYLIFCLIRTVNIFRRLEDYFICRSVLSQPHGGLLRDTIYFTTLVEDPVSGGKHFVDTHAIFFTRGICPPLMEDYANATVTLACNRETGMVVVLG